MMTRKVQDCCTIVDRCATRPANRPRPSRLIALRFAHGLARTALRFAPKKSPGPEGPGVASWVGNAFDFRRCRSPAPLSEDGPGGAAHAWPATRAHSD